MAERRTDLMAKNDNNLFVARDLGKEIQLKTFYGCNLHSRLARLWAFNEMDIFDAIFFAIF